MTKSELTRKIVNQCVNIQAKTVKNAVKILLEYIAITLIKGERIEIRDFGSFSLRYYPLRISRNSKNGNKIVVKGKYVPYFKPGKELSKRLSFV